MMFHIFCSDVLRKIITEQVAALAVLPNKIIVPLTTEIPVDILKMPEPEVKYKTYFFITLID